MDGCFRLVVCLVVGFDNFWMVCFLSSLLSGQQSLVTVRQRVRLLFFFLVLVFLFGCRLVVEVGLVLDRVTRVDVIGTPLLLADSRDDRLKEGMMNR